MSDPRNPNLPPEDQAPSEDVRPVEDDGGTDKPLEDPAKPAEDPNYPPEDEGHLNNPP